MKTLVILAIIELVVITSLLAANLDLNGGAAMISALASLLAVYYAAKAHKSSKDNTTQIVIVKQDLGIVRENIEKVEIATNSMKDALVLATEKEALARGTAAGILEERDRNKS